MAIFSYYSEFDLLHNCFVIQGQLPKFEVDDKNSNVVQEKISFTLYNASELVMSPYINTTHFGLKPRTHGMGFLSGFWSKIP